MAITNYWSTAVSYASNQTGWVTTPPPDEFAKDPAALAPEMFQSWSRQQQLAYINAKGTGDPKTIYLGGPAPDPLNPDAPVGAKAQVVTNGALLFAVVRAGYATEYVTLEPGGRAATDAEKALPPASLDADIFMAWRPEDRLQYVTDNGGTISLSLDGRSLYATLADDVATGNGVLIPTSGDAEPIPYYYLSGSAGGTPSSVVSTSAEWLFPSLDGDTNKLPVEDRPAQFYFDVTASGVTDAQKTAFLKDFAKWHSAYQLEYIKAHQSVPAGETMPRLDIVVTSPELRLTAFVSPDDPTKHFVVQSLDKAAIARMTKNEQLAVVDMGDAFDDLAASIGLAAVATASFGAATNTTNGGALTIVTPPPYTATGYADALIYAVEHTIASNKGSNVTLPDDAKLAFTAQLEILKEQIGNSAIISPADIQKKVDELRDRFNRLFAFYNVRDPKAEVWNHNNPSGAAATVTVYADVISADGTLSGVNRGYSVFLAQEKRIAELAESRMQLVRANGILNGKNLDVPYLVYKFQSLYNLSLEAQVVAETEEVNQQNDLLKTYAAIQDLINKTLAAFTKADDTKKAVLGLNNTGTKDITEAQWKVFSMFEDYLSGSHRAPDGTTVGGQKHPLEVLRGISRPSADFFYNAVYDPGHDTDGIFGPDTDTDNAVYNYDLNEYTHTQWSTFGTRLSETVTLINQNSQIKMNDINSMDKERNRHFELANNALAKMADIIGNIARAA